MREQSTPPLTENSYCFHLVCSVIFYFSRNLKLKALIPVYYDGGSFDANIVNQEHKNKIINTNGTRGFNVVRSTTPTSTHERESFHHTIKNITKDRTKTLQRI